MGNGAKAQQKRERAAKSGPKEGKSSLKINEQAKNIQCVVCKHTFLVTTRQLALQDHAVNRHSKTIDVCFPSFKADESSSKVNEQAKNILCTVCKQAFLITTPEPTLQDHASNRHSKTIDVCFPSFKPAKSSVKVTEQGKNVQCTVCKQTFLITASVPTLQKHASNHDSNTIDICFPSFKPDGDESTAPSSKLEFR